MLPGLLPPVGALAGSLPLSYIGTFADTTAQANFTFSNVPIGAPGLIVVVVSAQLGSGATISNVNIAGSSATSAVAISATSNPVGIFYRRVSSGGSISITVNNSPSVNGCSITVYRIVGNASDTPTHTGSSSGSSRTSSSVSLNIASNGVAIGGSIFSTNTTSSWTNLSENADAAIGTATYSAASSLYMAAQTGRTITVNSAASSTHRLVAASWA